MQAKKLKQYVLEALREMKAQHIVEINVMNKTSMTDFMIIASGTSRRHVKSCAEKVVATAKQKAVQPLGVEGEGQAEWVLVDLGDVLVHVMQPEVREFYALEELWQVEAESA